VVLVEAVALMLLPKLARLAHRTLVLLRCSRSAPASASLLSLVALLLVSDLCYKLVGLSWLRVWKQRRFWFRGMIFSYKFICIRQFIGEEFDEKIYTQIRDLGEDWHLARRTKISCSYTRLL
jgi:hypothetical protein